MSFDDRLISLFLSISYKRSINTFIPLVEKSSETFHNTFDNFSLHARSLHCLCKVHRKYFLLKSVYR